MSSSDQMWTDPDLTRVAEREARRLAKSFKADVTDAKEIYRTIMSVAIEHAQRVLIARSEL